MVIEGQGCEDVIQLNFDGADDARGLGRRAFLAFGASQSLILLGLLTAPVGCGEKAALTPEQRFMANIRALYPDPKVAIPIAQSLGWSEPQALAILTRDAVDELPNDSELAAFLEQRIRKDFIDERVQLVNRWTVSETEAAIAVVVAGPSL